MRVGLLKQTVLALFFLGAGLPSAWTQATPLVWVSSVGENFTQTGDVLASRNAGEFSNHLVAHFDPVTLAPGESITLAFDFTPKGFVGSGNISGNNNLRFGLFDSRGLPGNRMARNGENSSTNSSEGYAVGYNLGADSVSAILFARQGVGRLITILQAYHPIEKKRFPFTFQAEVHYRCEFQISFESENQISLRTTITVIDTGLSFELASRVPSGQLQVTSFDTVGFSHFGALAELEISNVKINRLPGNS